MDLEFRTALALSELKGAFQANYEKIVDASTHINKRSPHPMFGLTKAINERHVLEKAHAVMTEAMAFAKPPEPSGT